MKNFRVIGDFIDGTVLLRENDEATYENAQIIDPVSDDVARIMTNTWPNEEGETMLWIHAAGGVRIDDICMPYSTIPNYVCVRTKSKDEVILRGTYAELMGLLAATGKSNGNG